ncbi:MAG: drug/metabolite exporter YedA [Thermoanaerobaculales bacterium]
MIVVAALLTVYVIWGSTYLAIRIALEGFPPFLMAGARFVIAGGALFTFLRSRGAPGPSRRQWLGAAAIGGLLLVGGNGGVVFAEQTVASGLTALGVATVALWAALFAGLWGHWPRRFEWVGLVLGFGGVALLNLGGSLRASPAGSVALAVATMSWAFGSMWSRHLDLPSGLMASAAEMLTGGAMLLLLSAAVREPWPVLHSTRPLWALAYLVVFGSWLGFSAYVFLLRRVRPAVATSYAYVNPVIAVLLGVAFAGESIATNEWLAMPVILAGVALVVLSQGRSREAETGHGAAPLARTQAGAAAGES